MDAIKLKIYLFIILLTGINLAQHKTEVYLSEFNNPKLQAKIEQNATDFLTKLNLAYFDSSIVQCDNDYFTDNAKGAITNLFSTAAFQCGETEIIADLVKMTSGAGYEIRNIPFMVKVSKDSINYQDGVLSFNSVGMIDNIYFGIENHQYNKLLRTGKGVEDFRRRQLILNFIENFRTSYNRKDLDFLEKVFSENALIIVGHVLKSKPGKNNLLDRNVEKKKVEFIRFSKKEYIGHLKEVFKRNEFIDIGFESIDVVQHRIYNNIYGVQMKQYWKSSTYSDVGYLFLMIDFKDEDNPLIHVRAWQPEEATEPDSAISLGNFEIIE